MHHRRLLPALVLALAMAGSHSLLPLAALAAPHGSGGVPPTDEIEVLDPNADPLGRPAVEVHRVDGQMIVDIPPTVIVHKYYYSGDRSFQAQLLPGGPSIVVAGHPKSGERCYLEVQMPAGAPRVTYCAKSIDYDFGDRGMTITFCMFGPPKVTYRNGPTFKTKVGQAVHAEQWKHHAHAVASGTKHVVHSSHEMLHEAAIDTGAALQTVTLPVQNLMRMMPLGASMFDPDRDVVRAEKIAEHKRQHEIEKAQREARRNGVTRPTVR